jgi:hypothetical protein
MPTATQSGQEPNLPSNYVPLTHSEHLHPAGQEELGTANAGEEITATLILRRSTLPSPASAT